MQVITRDSAMDVIKQYINDYGSIIEDDLVFVERELEQKSYIVADRNRQQNIFGLCKCIDAVKIDDVLEAIRQDELCTWLTNLRIQMEAYLILISNENGKENENEND